MDALKAVGKCFGSCFSGAGNGICKCLGGFGDTCKGVFSGGNCTNLCKSVCGSVSQLFKADCFKNCDKTLCALCKCCSAIKCSGLGSGLGGAGKGAIKAIGCICKIVLTILEAVAH